MTMESKCEVTHVRTSGPLDEIRITFPDATRVAAGRVSFRTTLRTRRLDPHTPASAVTTAESVTAVCECGQEIPLADDNRGDCLVEYVDESGSTFVALADLPSPPCSHWSTQIEKVVRNVES